MDKNLFSSPVEKAAENIMYHIRANEGNNQNGKIIREKKKNRLLNFGWIQLSVNNCGRLQKH
jgi:hypothetical protein